MEERISARLVQKYSSEYAVSVADDFFSSSKSKIKGTEIADLCDTSQINFFVIRELLRAWKQEAQKYQSPYFDYDAIEVKEALNSFRNTLSNHISIARNHFIPLLKKGVSLTLYLILSPYDFYSYTLKRYGKDNIKTSHLRNEIKYIKINKEPLEMLMARLDEQRLNVISGKEAFSLFEQILEEVNFIPEDVDSHITQFNKVAPLEIPQLYEPVSDESPSVVFLQDDDADIILSDKAMKEKREVTMAENYQKIPYLKDWLTINQRFMFTKMLFNGNFEAFNEAINQIDVLHSFDEAINYLRAHYPSWNHTSEECQEFIELLTHRFS